MILGKRTIFRRIVDYMECGNMPHAIQLLRTKADQEDLHEARLFCDLCRNGELEMYMVLDTVWAAAGMGKSKGFLHLSCLETRLGRRLSKDDFPKYVINKAILFAFERGKG